MHPTHVRSCTRLTQTERASACLFADTWDCTWRNRPCAKLPPPTARKSSPPPHPKIPPNPIQPPFGQLANNIPQNPLPPVPLHSIRSAKAALPATPIRRRPRFVKGTHGDPLAPTVRSRRLSSSSRAATAGDVLVEAHGGQRRHRWRRSCGDARRSASPTVRAF